MSGCLLPVSLLTPSVMSKNNYLTYKVNVLN